MLESLLLTYKYSYMNESLQHTYLSALGIVQWVPRLDMSGNNVVPSIIQMEPRFGDLSYEPVQTSSKSITIEVENNESVTSISTTKERPKSDISNIIDFDVVDTASEIELKQVNENSDVVDDPSVKFSVRVYSINEGIALIDICHHKFGHQIAHDQLASSLIRAINRYGDLSISNFQWPFAQNPRFDSRKSAAISSTTSFFSSLRSRINAKYLILLGEANNYFFDNDLDKTSYDFSLTDILNNKIQKEVVWEMLKKVPAECH